MSKGFWVYIVASRKNGTLYVGHTDDLAKWLTLDARIYGKSSS
jgi:predicted GIY-YIG superfamily endonuclease